MNLIKYFLTSIIFINAFLGSEEIAVPNNVLKVINQYFEDTPELDIRITPLIGGHSSLNFYVELPSNHYVLRFNERASVERFQCELFAMQEASKAGISPFVFESFPNEKMVLMEYIDGNTLTIEQSNQVEICNRIAKVLQKAHSIKENPHHSASRNKIMETFYAQLSTFSEILEETSQAIKIIRKGHDILKNMSSSYSVNTHNDLNPGNILVAEDRVVFIDWEGTNWEDPFYDLSYFSIFHDYDSKRELNLLESYLDKKPSLEELQRYYLTKKINFARISLSCYFIAFIQNKPNIDNEIQLKNWKYYVRAFANKSYDELPISQLFYNLARAAFLEAKSINYEELSDKTFESNKNEHF